MWMVGARGLAAALPVPRVIVPESDRTGAREGGVRQLAQRVLLEARAIFEFFETSV